MRFVTLVFAALAAGPLAAFAAPAPAEDAAQSCPDGAKIHCGVSHILNSFHAHISQDSKIHILIYHQSCNGTSCRIGFEN